ncbi:MAG: amidase [Pseudomonadota bacterium]
MDDTVNAFVSTFEVEGAPGGPLAGLTTAIKDIYDVAGHVTGCGNPEWVRTHGAASANAPAVDVLLGAGARIVGKTHTDELAYSLMGANAHYGTPVNSADPTRVPGGSSSGSAAAVAAGLVDVGLGSDTGGSVRLPASFCGIYGLRTTFGTLDLGGAMALAPSFDTVGWFARDAATMVAVAAAFGLTPGGIGAPRLALPVDAWTRCDAATIAAVLPMLAALEAAHGPAVPVKLADEGLDAWREVFRIAQAGEVWQVHGEWVSAHTPNFGPGVAERFGMAEGIEPGAFAEALAAKGEIAARMRGLLSGSTVLVMPSSPGPAPKRDTDAASLDGYRMRALEILCPAGLAGLPQYSIPTGEVEGGPVGLSLVGPAGSDADLLELVAALA